MNEKIRKPINRTIRNKVALALEILLTIGICFAISLINISGLKTTAARAATEVDTDYNALMDDYITSFNALTLIVEEKIEEDYSFDEMMEWLQSMDSVFEERIGSDVYDAFSMTYKGGYVRSWDYGDYSNYDATTRPWYQRAEKADGRAVMVPPYVTYLDPSSLEEDEYILMSVAKKYNDEIYFDYDLKIKDIADLLSKRTYDYKGSRAILFDPQGYVLSSSNSKEYGHNINTSDDVISQEFSEAVVESSEDIGTLSFASVDDKWKIIYTTKDSRDNTFCVLIPFFEVFYRSFMVIVIIAMFLIALEIYLYFNNARSILEFKRRDERLSAITDAAFQGHVYVDIDSMTFSGNDELSNACEDTYYDTMYNLVRGFLVDEEERKRFEEFLSPGVIKKEREYDGQIQTERFTVKIEGETQKNKVYQISKIVSYIENRRVMSLLSNDVTEDAEILKEALKNAEAASKAKSEFLSRMSHDIRTPMNAIIGFTKLAEKEQCTPEIKEYLEGIESSSEFLLGLINDILDLSKIESGNIDMQPEPLTLIDFRNEIINVFGPLAAEKNIKFEVNLNGGAPCIMVDKLRYSQMFFNLLSNAIKYTPKGGHVSMSSEHTTIKDDKYGLRFHIKDNGIGMSPEFMEHLFEPFMQEKTPYSADIQGTGLGLPIVKNIVDAFGGTITVNSVAGQGTEFIVDLFLPLAEPIEKIEEVEKEEIELKGKNILLAEDNRLNVMVAKRLLESKGCIVDVANNGLIALDKFIDSPIDFYDAILMDIRMPVLDGIGATEKIRDQKREDSKKIPIIAMTAEVFADEKLKTIEAGMNYHLSKPIEPDKLYETLSKLIAERKK